MHRAEMKALSERVLGKLHFNLEQVQDLTPTPMTLSSVMFYTGENPYTHEKVYVARSQEEKRRQKSYFFGGKGRPGQRPFRKGAREPAQSGNIRKRLTKTSAFLSANTQDPPAKQGTPVTASKCAFLKRRQRRPASEKTRSAIAPKALS